jgi:uncharacterized membrane protein YozB (DUF420 family)
MITMLHLPTVNAVLNFTSAVLLSFGLFFILKKNVFAHRVCMTSAIGVSTIFLASYVTYHLKMGSTKFLGTGWIRPCYFAILISHSILAVIIVPLVLVTFVRAWAGRFEAHKKIARWTWPIWMYVSVSGVVIYLLLYHFDKLS